MLLNPEPLQADAAAAGGLRWCVRRTPPPDARPCLLLLHGTGSSGLSWAGSAAHLAPTYSLLVPDLPGHGGTDGFADGVASLPRMARAVAALLQAQQVSPVAVVGHSAGAALMLRLWLDGALPDARALLSLNGALLPLPGVAGTVFPVLARALTRVPMLPWLAAQAASQPRAVQRLVDSTGSRLGAGEVAHYQGLLRQPSHLAGALQMMAHWDVTPLVPALRQRLARDPLPLMLAAGRRDTTVPCAQSGQVARALPGTLWRPLERLGHLAHEEAPALVADLLWELMLRASR
ncbi:alpha/beta fold hydrolase BchO [uncultured Pseudacidovorax sp.]|uniref:alpha/beta fold hydrolase BchO n=1 Tax=uncultured Pseudacidovorax sp. TaxID=679313 RepID=UPI0025E34EC9|nr:alpha/beta fold hydrolase BchO [uncultured Pseudacidovorax sp.]